MKSLHVICLLVLLAPLAHTASAQEEPKGTPPAAASADPAKEPPIDWIDPDTGHRIVRLSREPYSASLYFHQNAYTASGDKLLITLPDGLATVNLKTWAIDPIAKGKAAHVVVGKNAREVYYNIDDLVYATHLDTHTTRQIGKIPEGWHWGSGFAVNADETLLAGSLTQGTARYLPPIPRQNWQQAPRRAFRGPRTDGAFHAEHRLR